jgi:hypothetical protein
VSASIADDPFPARQKRAKKREKHRFCIEKWRLGRQKATSFSALISTRPTNWKHRAALLTNSLVDASNERHGI